MIYDDDFFNLSNELYNSKNKNRNILNENIIEKQKNY